MTSQAASAMKKYSKAKSTKSESTHPRYADMIKEAIISLKNKKGSSRFAILKYINEHYDIHENFADQTNKNLRLALKHGVENKTLKQVKGIGASGSFKLDEAFNKMTISGTKSKKNDTGKSAASKKTAATSHGSGKTTTKSESTHPKYAAMIKEAIVNLKNRKGSSRIAILKYIKEHYDIHENFADQTNVQLRHALKHGVENKTLKQVKGIGASGSFKLGENSGNIKMVKSASTPKTTERMRFSSDDSMHSSPGQTPKKASATKKVGNVKGGIKVQATKKSKTVKK